jgi:hypothetical protein
MILEHFAAFCEWVTSGETSSWLPTGCIRQVLGAAVGVCAGTLKEILESRKPDSYHDVPNSDVVVGTIVAASGL